MLSSSFSSRKFPQIMAFPVKTSLLIVAWLGLGCGSDDGDTAPPASESYASWAASPQDYAEPIPFPPAPVPEVFADRSVRQVLRLSAGGDRLRVRLSNLFGSEPLDVESAGVARSAGGATIDVASHVALTFGGAPGVSVAAGQELWSDYIPFAADSETEVAVTLYLPGAEPVATVHSLGQQSTFVAGSDLVTAVTFPADANLSATGPRLSYYWLTGVDVQGATARRVVVTFGDSITDGFGSTPDANTRYPNFLSERLTAASAPGSFSVVNAGISGNRVLNDVIGPSGVSRFERDVLGQAGVTDVVILLGINDIGFSGFVPEQEVPVEAITGALGALVELANVNGVRTHLGTLLPFQGTMAPYYSDAAEAKREAVNTWIRANTRAAGVIDFDATMRDPANPLAIQAAFDSGDHLHPNDVGYEAMAEAIDPGLFD
jgi:lysophospholipase L1-like esterase